MQVLQTLPNPKAINPTSIHINFDDYENIVIKRNDQIGLIDGNDSDDSNNSEKEFKEKWYIVCHQDILYFYVKTIFSKKIQKTTKKQIDQLMGNIQHTYLTDNLSTTPLSKQHSITPHAPKKLRLRTSTHPHVFVGINKRLFFSPPFRILSKRKPTK